VTILIASALSCTDEGAVRQQAAAKASAARAAATATPAASEVARFSVARLSPIGTWNEVIANPTYPNSIASDSMRHMFRENGTVLVRMDETKPQAFKWSFANNVHTVVYKYGKFEHAREFRMRSADEADVVESNGHVLGTYLREGSLAASKKASVSIFGETAAAKDAVDVTTLADGSSWTLAKHS
jgi:hypothetical protein